MTALAACLSWTSSTNARHATDRMLSAQTMFGPDSSTLDGTAAFACGRNLMRTTSDDSVDRQPLRFAGGRYHLVADIRLDNRDEILESLDISPQRGRMFADSAVLASALERWGLQATLPRLVGEFAFILWDQKTRQMTLVRDPLGLRPLFWTRQGGFVAASGMVKGLLALPTVDREFDETRLAEVLALLPDDSDRTVYRGLHRVRPGCWIGFTERGDTHEEQWETLEAIPEHHGISFEDALEAIDDAMMVATKSMLRSTSPVLASHLSAGLDSGVVTAMAARCLADTATPLHAFTAVPRDLQDIPPALRSIGDEGPQAEKLAALWPHVVHHRVFNDADSMLDTNARYVAVMDDTPLNPSNMVWVDRIAREARDAGATVLLSGAMGNLTFSSGFTPLLAELLCRGHRLGTAATAVTLWHKGELTPRQSLSILSRSLLPQSLFAWLYKRHSRAPTFVAENSDRVQPSLRARTKLSARVQERFTLSRLHPARDHRLRVALLRQSDVGAPYKAILATHRVELRDPTADLRVVRLCLSLPPLLFVHGRDRAFGKALYARHASADCLATHFRGRQGADMSRLMAAECDDIARVVREASRDSTLFIPTEIGPQLSALRPPAQGDLPEAQNYLLHLTKLSRLAGISQLVSPDTRCNQPPKSTAHK